MGPNLKGLTEAQILLRYNFLLHDCGGPKSRDATEFKKKIKDDRLRGKLLAVELGYLFYHPDGGTITSAVAVPPTPDDSSKNNGFFASLVLPPTPS